MKNKDIMAFYEGLISLKQRVELCFSAKVAYSIIRNIKILEPIYQDIVSVRTNILNEHGVESTENPGYWNIKEGHNEIVQEEFRKIDELENDITLYKVTIEDLKGSQLSVADMEILFLMLEE